MLRPLSTVVFAASIWAAALALPAQAKDSETVPAPAASSSDITSRAQAATPAVKRVRKARTQSRRLAVASSARYYPQCFLFWCTGGGRPFHFLVLGVAY